MKKGINLIILPIVILFFLTGCTASLSFTGASISPDVKTVEIQYFENKASIVNPMLSQLFTNALKDKFMSQTTLDLVEKEGDLVFSGYIKSYDIAPIAIQGDQTAAMNRLSVSVFVNFVNKQEPNDNFEKTFSFKKEYRSDLPLTEIDDAVLPEINEALVENVFNQSVVNW